MDLNLGNSLQTGLEIDRLRVVEILILVDEVRLAERLVQRRLALPRVFGLVRKLVVGSPCRLDGLRVLRCGRRFKHFICF